MAALIQHFGDTADGLRPCGHCDFCAPQNATAQTFRPPTTEEDRQLRAILRALDGQTRATGKLHTELSTGALRNTPAADRKVFDTLLDALARAGLITLNTDQWTNPEGNLITFKKASLTHEGRTLTGPLPPDLLLKDTTAYIINFVAKKTTHSNRHQTLESVPQSRARTNHRRLHSRTKISRSHSSRLAQSRSRQNRQARLHGLRRQRPPQPRPRTSHQTSPNSTPSPA